jgi:hypothetical protein
MSNVTKALIVAAVLGLGAVAYIVTTKDGIVSAYKPTEPVEQTTTVPATETPAPAPAQH